jgi:hypothetical protein
MVTMGRFAQALFLVSLLAGCARHAPPLTAVATAPAGSRALSVRDLNDRPVLGALGIPLGSVARVRAVLTTGNSKDDADRYRLRVTRVDTRDLSEPVELDFTLAPGAHAILPRVRESEPDYVGRQVDLIAYETGAFSGIPTRGLEGYANWQGRAFHFTTSLEVLEESAEAK